MFELMKDFKGGKKGMEFDEVSEELMNPTLKQRGRQETRWARVDLLAMEAFMRNASTIYSCLERDLRKALLEKALTEAKKEKLLEKQENIRKKMEIMKDSDFWLYFMGYLQIMNIVVEASMEAQHESYFSSSALHLVQTAMEKIKALSEKWVWEEDSLFFVGVGSPSQHVENIKNGFFQPQVSVRAKKRAARQINSLRAYRRQLDGESDDEFEPLDDSDIEVGTINIENFEVYKEIRVSRALEAVCEELFSNYEERLRPSPLQLIAIEAFNIDPVWFNLEEDAEPTEGGDLGGISGVVSDAHQVSPISLGLGEDDQISDEDVISEDLDDLPDIDENYNEGGGQGGRPGLVSAAHQVSPVHDPDELQNNYDYCALLMKRLLEVLPESIQFRYNEEAVIYGYILFIRLKKKMGGNISLEKVYEHYYKLYSAETDSSDFISLFQKVQIKSYSEAIAETLGSIMKISKGKGRNLEPLNFSREIYCVFNLPPMHVLKRKFIPEIAQQLMAEKSFFRKCASSFPSYQSKLKFETLSASLGNYRSKEEKRCRLPLEFF